MSEQELNSYRLTSMEEPSDEMLSAIMKEAAVDAQNKAEVAYRRFFEDLQAKGKEIQKAQRQ